MNIHICKITSSREERSSKARNCTYYLDRIQDFGFEFDKLEAYCTDGDIRPPYPYQWLATTKIKEGDDDAIEGIGESPLEAIRNLKKAVSLIVKNPKSDYEGECEVPGE